MLRLNHAIIITLCMVLPIIGTSCSSRQDAIEQAVEQTVEAQQVAISTEQPVAAQATAIPQSTEESAENTQPEVDTQSAVPSTEQNELGLAEGILGIWSAADDTWIPWDVVDTYTFYPDVVIVEGTDIRERAALAFVYDFLDANTIELKYPGFDVPMAVVRLIQQTPDILHWVVVQEQGEGIELSELDKLDEQLLLESPTITRLGTVEHENVDSIPTTMEGMWAPTDDEWGTLVALVDDHIVGHYQDNKLIPHFRYEYVESNRLLAASLHAGSDMHAEVSMPNSDKLIIWFWTDEYFSDVVVMDRVSMPTATFGPVIDGERPENEILYPFPGNSGDASNECGYIDKTGKIILEPKFVYCGDFHEGLARVQLFSQTGYIDNTGNFVIEPQFYTGDDFSEDVAAVGDFETRKVGYIDKTGAYVIPPQYDNVDPFSDGLAYVTVLDPEWKAYIDKTGAVAFEVNGPNVYGGRFQDGVLRTQDGYLDRSGQIITDPAIVGRGVFSEGLASFHLPNSNQCHYVDQDGQTVIETEFRTCFEFSEGYATVYRADPFGCGYIDKSGGLTIDIRFDQCYSFSEGRAAVQVGDYFGYIDTQGNYIFDPYDLEFASEFRNGLAKILAEYGKWGYIDRDGNYVLEP